MIQPEGFPGLPENWSESHQTIPSHSGDVKLFLARYQDQSPNAPRRALLVMHGLNEHGGRYLHFPHYLRGTFGQVYCLDHRGHGRSEGLRGHLDRFDTVVEDAASAVRRVASELGGSSELHLYAHSFGGLIGLRMLLLNSGLPLQSASISAPLLGIAVELPLVKRAAAQLLSRVWGTLQMATEIDPAILSRDPAVGRAYAKDRLVHRKGTPKIYTELLAAMSDTLARAEGSRIDVPFQMLIPRKDRIVSPEASLEFYRRIERQPGAARRLVEYPEFFHEIANETEKEKVFEDVKQWTLKHSKA